jgi:hypothetical protein
MVCGGRRSATYVQNLYASRTTVVVYSTLTLAFRPYFRHTRRSHRSLGVSKGPASRPVVAALVVPVAIE